MYSAPAWTTASAIEKPEPSPLEEKILPPSLGQIKIVVRFSVPDQAGGRNVRLLSPRHQIDTG